MNLPGEHKKPQREVLFTSEFIRVLLVHFLAMGSAGIYFFLPRFIRLTGGEEFLIGLIMGAPGVAAVFFRLPAGSWIDRFGRKRMLIAGLGLASIAAALPVFAHRAGAYLLIVRALAGGSIVLYFTAIVTYVAEKAPSTRRIEAISIYGAGGFVAQAISPYLCEWLLKVLPVEPINRYRILFALAALFSCLSFFLSLRLGEDKPHQEKHLAPDPWIRVLRSPTMIYLFIASLVFGIGYTSMFSFVTDFTKLEKLGSPSSFFISYSVTVIILRISTGHLLDRLDRRLVVLAALIIISAGLYYASFCTGKSGLIIVGILTGTGHGYIFPSLSSLTYDSSPARNRGTSMALYMLGFDLSVMLATPILGRIAETWNYLTMYRISSLMVLAGVLIYATGWRYHAPEALSRSARGLKDMFAESTGAFY
ncbi:MAG TPA: MFS transporter [archaeon]|nr:MFS transporter [archaeon]